MWDSSGLHIVPSSQHQLSTLSTRRKLFFDLLCLYDFILVGSTAHSTDGAGRLPWLSDKIEETGEEEETTRPALPSRTNDEELRFTYPPRAGRATRWNVIRVYATGSARELPIRDPTSLQSLHL